MTDPSEAEAVERWLGCRLPSAYRVVLDGYGGRIIGDRVCLYAVEDLIERNETYETQIDCPDFFTIGDDSGGRGIVIAKSGEHCRVYLVDHGSMHPDDFHVVSEDLTEWIRDGCPLPE